MLAMEYLFVFAVGALLSQANCHPNGNLTSQNGVSDGTKRQAIPITSAPYVASIYEDSGDSLYKFQCGASIIHEQFVLTVAECCPSPKNKDNFVILVGTDKYEQFEGTDGQFVQIEQIIIHEKYDYTDFNVCLIKLQNPLNLGPKIGVINVANSGYNLSGGTVLTAVGWKEIKNPDSTQILYEYEIPFVTKKKCKDMWSVTYMTITQRMICAGGEGYEYPGSAGSLLNVGDIQVGLSTLTTGKTQGLPSVYTRAASMSAWINRKIRQFE